MQTDVTDPKESEDFFVVELDVEEMEEVIAPRIAINHNETLALDATQ